MTPPHIFRVVALAFALVLVAGCDPTAGATTTADTPAAAAPPPPPPLTVQSVVDGDTVDLSDGRRVRLLGIDTPERGECGFDQATQFATEQLLGKQVTATPDPTQDQTDRYGRHLLYLAPGGGSDYSTAVTRAGWAKRYVYAGKPVQKDPQIADAEQAAKTAKAGMWADAPTGCATPPPPPAAAPQSPRPAPARQENTADENVRRAPAPPPSPKPEPPPPPPAQPKHVPPPPPPKQDSPPPAGGGAVYYKNCAAARAAGAAPVYRGQPGYGKHLDRDGDGIGCE